MSKNNKKFVLKVNKIEKSFENKKVLDNVSFNLYFGEKIGLVGSNGAGKSTLMKILTKKIEADSGGIEVFKNFKISYLPQEIQESILVKEYLNFEKSRLAEVLKLLAEFSFSGEILLRKISSLSGGQRTKIFLIKIILEKAEIVLLDEPTNNLDIDGLKKLEEIIQDSKSAFLIISHDRRFLDNTVTKILELEKGRVKIYDGNYSDYKIKKEADLKRLEELYVSNQKEKTKLETEVLRKKAKASRKMSGTKIRSDNNKLAGDKRIENVQQSAGRNLKRAKTKLEQFQEREKIKTKRPLIIDFSEMKRSGNKVLVVENLILPFGSQEKINLEVFAGDRVLISGKNGSGKTTFLKEIFSIPGMLPIKWGEKVEIGYLPQDFLKEENLEKKFLEYFQEKTGLNLTESRKIISRFGFYDEEINLKISELSPGLRGRGVIAIMLAKQPNVLILDEPTNNLDLEVLEELEKALEKYQGTIIFVSHDRYFIEKMKPNKELKIERKILKKM